MARDDGDKSGKRVAGAGAVSPKRARAKRSWAGSPTCVARLARMTAGGTTAAGMIAAVTSAAEAVTSPPAASPAGAARSRPAACPAGAARSQPAACPAAAVATAFRAAHRPLAPPPALDRTRLASGSSPRFAATAGVAGTTGIATARPAAGDSEGSAAPDPAAATAATCGAATAATCGATTAARSPDRRSSDDGLVRPHR